MVFLLYRDLLSPSLFVRCLFSELGSQAHGIVGLPYHSFLMWAARSFLSSRDWAVPGDTSDSALVPRPNELRTAKSAWNTGFLFPGKKNIELYTYKSKLPGVSVHERMASGTLLHLQQRRIYFSFRRSRKHGAPRYKNKISRLLAWHPHGKTAMTPSVFFFFQASSNHAAV